jgi:hypothetical protein
MDPNSLETLIERASLYFNDFKMHKMALKDLDSFSTVV